MANLPQSELYSGLTSAATSLGQSASKTTKSFDNLKSKVKGYSPVSPTPSSTGLGTVTTPYGGSTKFEGFHPGVDIANTIGTPIPSYAGGTVTESVSGKRQGEKGYGNYIIITDDQGNKWRYSHLNKGYVSIGQRINPGQNIGEMGNTGSTYSLSGGTGSHLDLRLQDAAGKYLNPLSYTTK